MRAEYYQFKPEDAQAFVSHIKTKAYQKGTELVFKKCPYCRSEKDKDTFSISLKTGQFQCKRASCGVKGNMISLSQDFGFSLGTDVDAHYNVNNVNATKYKKYGKLHKYEPKPQALEYLAGRGISYDIANKYHITTYKDSDNIMVFPFTDEMGNLISTKYRKMDFRKGVDKNKEWFEKDNKPVLFGMEQCDTKNPRLVITEGQIDSLSLAEAGIENAISVPNGANAFTWIPFCWDFVSKFKEIVVFGDYEHDKVTLVDTINSRFGRILTVKAVRPRDYQEHKDANDILRSCGKQALVNAVDNAEVVTASHIFSMEKVEVVDMDKLEAFKTGFKTIDSVLGHGIPFGSLVILTGKRGDGKSTFASQIYAEALNQNYKCFIYSGELPNYMVKAWLDRQLSGMRTLNNNVIDKINNWYKDKSFIFDNRMLDDEPERVENVVEEAILRFDCRVIVIDNLMTAMRGSTAESVYHDQGNFVRKMAVLCKKYNVAIILIAHPRKGGEVSDPDCIAGSSDIANAADIIMAYERIKDASQDIRGVSVTKNRYNNGRILVNDNAVRVKYSTESMRIVEENDSFNKDYGWRKVDANGFIEIETCDEVPWEDDNEN